MKSSDYFDIDKDRLRIDLISGGMFLTMSFLVCTILNRKTRRNAANAIPIVDSVVSIVPTVEVALDSRKSTYEGLKVVESISDVLGTAHLYIAPTLERYLSPASWLNNGQEVNIAPTNIQK